MSQVIGSSLRHFKWERKYASPVLSSSDNFPSCQPLLPVPAVFFQYRPAWSLSFLFILSTKHQALLIPAPCAPHHAHIITEMLTKSLPVIAASTTSLHRIHLSTAVVPPSFWQLLAWIIFLFTLTMLPICARIVYLSKALTQSADVEKGNTLAADEKASSVVTYSKHATPTEITEFYTWVSLSRTNTGTSTMKRDIPSLFLTSPSFETTDLLSLTNFSTEGGLGRDWRGEGYEPGFLSPMDGPKRKRIRSSPPPSRPQRQRPTPRLKDIQVILCAAIV
jgi:hypothetical protein